MRGSIISVLLCCLVDASEAPRAERRRLEAYNYQEVAKLTASDAAFRDYFGVSVAIDGNTVVVGANQQYWDGSSWIDVGPGAVYAFRTTDSGATYEQVAKLTADDAASGDGFGISVAIDGGTVVVGALGAGTGGAVYVFHTTDGATYGQVAKLTASDGANGDEFGISVAIAGDTVVVGSCHDDGGGSNSGSAYVFHTTDGGATYDQVAKLTASDGAADDRFGISVAVDGDTIVIGSHYDDDALPGWPYYSDDDSQSGSAYVFHTTDSGATYGQVAKLTADDPTAGDGFGISVAIDGNTVVVGARGDSRWIPCSAYVFHTSDGGESYRGVAKLTGSDIGRSDYQFGISVAIAGDTVVVGANHETLGCCDSLAGAVYVFRTSDGGATYVEVAKLTRSTRVDIDPRYDEFGNSVAIYGNTIVAGAYKGSVGYSYLNLAGAAYVFDANAPTSQPTTSQPTTGAPTPQPTAFKPTQQPTAQQQLGLLPAILISVAAAVLVSGCLYFVLTAKKKQPMPHARDGAASTDPTVPSAPPLPPLPPPSAPPHFRYREAAEAECATPAAVQVARPEVARPVAGTSTAPFATVVNVQRIVRGWSARGLQRLASWRATPEEEV